MVTLSWSFSLRWLIIVFIGPVLWKVGDQPLKEDFKKRKKNPHCKGTRKTRPKNNPVVRDLKAVLPCCPRGWTYPQALRDICKSEEKGSSLHVFHYQGENLSSVRRCFLFHLTWNFHMLNPLEVNWGNTPFIHQADPKLVTEVEKRLSSWGLRNQGIAFVWKKKRQQPLPVTREGAAGGTH